MKNLILLFCLIYSISTTAQIINIPDANFKNALVNTNCASFSPTIYPLAVDDVDTNDDGEIQVSEALAVTGLVIQNKQISSLSGIEEFTNLLTLHCKENQLTSLDLQGLNDMVFISCGNNQLTDLNITGLDSLQAVNCNNNNLTSIDISGHPSLLSINCRFNDLTTLNISGANKLENIACAVNKITSLDISVDMVSLNTIHCNNNQLPFLHIPNLPLLRDLNCAYNPMDSFSLSPLLPNLEQLRVDDIGIDELDVSTYDKLINLYCRDNYLTTLDVQNCGNLYRVFCSSNLGSLFTKNGSDEMLFIENSSVTGFNNNLAYICADEFEIADVKMLVDTNLTTVNSYCTFVPGGLYYPVQGQVRMDLDLNGCDANDPLFPNLKFHIQNATDSIQMIANMSGYYGLSLLEGPHTIIPELENNYFSISPDTLLIDFPNDTFPFIQDYCLEPLGVISDLKISILPIDPARPGFDATYKIVYKNNGTQIENGSINFNYDENVLDFVVAEQTPDFQGQGILTWNFSDFNPYQSNSIIVTLNCNSPVESPPLNISDILNFDATIQGSQLDVTPNNNIFTIHQTVVGAFDPNDKTCLEGDIITPEMIGNDVHYLIRFENTGNYAAENILVTDVIDTSTFEINTLQVVDASHEIETRIVKGNQVEFIFENILLPFDDLNNDGFVLFKIKTVSNLVIGDSLNNQAAIYFDFNPPIITNQVLTTIGYPDFDQDGFNSIMDCDDNNPNINPDQVEILNNEIDDNCNGEIDEIISSLNKFQDKDFKIFPNPVKDIIHIQTKYDIDSIEVFDFYGRLIPIFNLKNNMLHTEHLPAGTYIIKIQYSEKVFFTKFFKI